MTSYQMRKLIRSFENGGAVSSRTERAPLSDEEREKRAEQRALRRIVLEFWSKGAKGYSRHSLTHHRSLNLSSCSLYDDDGEALSSELTPAMTNLKLLDFTDNKFGDRTLIALSAALTQGAAPLLSHLHLGHNAISDAGMEAFGEALGGRRLTYRGGRDEWTNGVLPRLERLDLSHNAIGPKGASHLAKAAQVEVGETDEDRDDETSRKVALQQLTCLVLSDNPIGKEGVEALATAAQDPHVLPSLTELQIRRIGSATATENGLAVLCEAMLPKTGGLPRLRTLLVDDRHINYDKLREVYAARAGTGQGTGLHALNLDHIVTTQTSPIWHMGREDLSTPRVTPRRVQQSPRFSYNGV